MRSAYRDEDQAATRRMSGEAADFMTERALHLIVWGLVLGFPFALDAARTFVVLPFSALVEEGLWVALFTFAAVLSYVFERYHAVSPANALTSLLRWIWGVVGLGALILGFLGGVTGLVAAGPRAGGLAVLVAIGFTLTCAIAGGRALAIVAVAWWALAAAFFFLNPAAADFLAASAFFGLMVLPSLQAYVGHRLVTRSTKNWNS